MTLIDAPWCCSIDDAGAQCEAEAAFDIWHQCGHFECGTQSCATHIEALFGCIHTNPQPDPGYLVIPLVSDNEPSKGEA